MTAPADPRLHHVRFPLESDEYRSARDKLLAAEITLRRQVEAVSEQRCRLPLGGAAGDYTFDEWDRAADAAKRVTLSGLFEAGKDTPASVQPDVPPRTLRSALEAGCPSCTLIIDAIDGEVPHITQRINFAVVARAPIDRSARTPTAGGGATPGCSRQRTRHATATTKLRPPTAVRSPWPPSSYAEPARSATRGAPS